MRVYRAGAQLMTTLRLRRCDCGSENLKARCERICEDAEGAWIECLDCGAVGEETDDAYCDYEGAADLWNRRDLRSSGKVTNV